MALNPLNSIAGFSVSETYVTVIDENGNVYANNLSFNTLTGTAGNISTTGNITANYFIGNGSQLTGLPAGYSNADVAAYLPTYTGNITSGNISATGNINGNIFIGNGSQLTGIVSSYGDSNVESLLSSGSVTNISATGNINSATLTASGNISALTGTFRNGDTGTSYNQPQITFTYANTLSYPQWIHTRHNTSGVENAIDFYTGDGTANASFPINAILGLTVTDGKVGINQANPGNTLDVAGPSYFTSSVTASSFIGEGGNISNIQAVSIVGTVANATYATSSGTSVTVTGNTQSNINLLGTLSSLDVTGNAVVGAILTDNYLWANGDPIPFGGGNSGNGGVSQVNTGTGLTGGPIINIGTIAIANTGVANGWYGGADTVGTFQVNDQGQLISASNATIAITNTQVSGLGTLSTQDANAVSITGGSISGVSDISLGSLSASGNVEATQFVFPSGNSYIFEANPLDVELYATYQFTVNTNNGFQQFTFGNDGSLNIPNNVSVVGNVYGSQIGNSATYLYGDGSNITGISACSVSGLASVATSGLYSDLSGQPTDLSDFSNGPGFISAVNQDTGPSLGGDLNTNGYNITGGDFNGLLLNGGSTNLYSNAFPVTITTNENTITPTVWTFDIAGNLSTPTGGNIIAGFYYGDGSNLQNITVTEIANGTSNISVAFNDSVDINVNGNNWDFSTDGILTAPGNISTTGNVIATNDVIANGALTGSSVGYGYTTLQSAGIQTSVIQQYVIFSDTSGSPTSYTFNVSALDTVTSNIYTATISGDSNLNWATYGTTGQPLGNLSLIGSLGNISLAVTPYSTNSITWKVAITQV